MEQRSAAFLHKYLAEPRLIFARLPEVWRLLPRAHKLALTGAGVLTGMVGVCNTIFPLLLGQMLDGVKASAEHGAGLAESYGIAGYFLAWMAGIFLLREAAQVLRRYLVENSRTRIEKIMTVKVFSQLMKAELSSLTEEKIGALQGRLSRSIVGFVRFVRLVFLDFCPLLFTGLFALLAAVSKQPLLTLAMVGVIPISLFLTLRQLASQKGIRLALLRSREELDGLVVEQLAGVDYVRAANMHDYEAKRVTQAAERRRAMENRHHFQMSLFGCAKSVNEGIFHILVLACAAFAAINGSITYGDVLTFSFLFLNVMAPLNEVHRGLDEGHECSLMVADVLALLGEPADPSFAPDRVEEPRPVPGQPIVEVEDLVVEVPGINGNGKRILAGVSLVVRHGETIGLAGPSGCGKTTWLRVLLRLTHPTSGKVCLGGVPLQAVSRDAIGRLVGYVGQSPFVFAGTVEENIRYGLEVTSLEAIHDAARRACLHDEIMNMANGYHTVIKERGLNLSAGQRQRLALARVFLKNPPILILDEGTSALDTISERHIQRAIDLARQDRTVILVAHRLSTLLDADRIYVFQNGRIVETGTYVELYQIGGAFTELVKSAEVGVTGATVPWPQRGQLG